MIEIRSVRLSGLLLAFSVGLFAEDGGTLHRAGDAVRGTEPTAQSASASDDGDHRAHGHTSGLSNEASEVIVETLVIGAAALVLAPFALAQDALHDDGGFDHPVPVPEPVMRATTPRVVISGSVDYGRVDGNLDRVTAELDLRSRWRIDLSTRWAFYRERLANGGEDHVAIGTTALWYRAAQGERSSLRVGVGANTWHDQIGTTWGVMFGLGADVVPIEHLVFGAGAEIGSIEHVSAWRLRATVGGAWRWFEPYAGWDAFRVGGVDLGGPVAGLRLWF